jgi:hypothetical protein
MVHGAVVFANARMIKTKQLMRCDYPRENFSTNTVVSRGYDSMDLRGLFGPRDSDLLLDFSKPPETAVCSNRGYERFSKKNQLVLL